MAVEMVRNVFGDWITDILPRQNLTNVLTDWLQNVREELGIMSRYVT
jgi:hypothetical protein